MPKIWKIYVPEIYQNPVSRNHDLRTCRGASRPVSLQQALTGWMHPFRQVNGEASETEPSIFDQTLVLTTLSSRNILGGFKPHGGRSTG